MQRTACVCVSGHVQAVGYRMFVRRYADQLSITGFAQNLPDGRVKIVASGSKTKIEELLQKVRQGPRFAVVRNVEVRWLADYAPFSRFDVT
ncbi:MAG: acylphosphatase [Halobacteriota archaeon]